MILIKQLILSLCILSTPFFAQGQIIKKKIKKALYDDKTFQELQFFKLSLEANKTEREFYDYDPEKSDMGGVVPEFMRNVLNDPSKITMEELIKERNTYYSIVDRYNSLIQRIQDDIEEKVQKRFQEFQNLDYQYYKEEIVYITDDFKNYSEGLRKYYPQNFLSIDYIRVIKFLIGGLEKLAVRRVKRIVISELNNLKLKKIDWDILIDAKKNQLPIQKNDERSIEFISNVTKEAGFALSLNLESYPNITIGEVERNYKQEKHRLEVFMANNDLQKEEKEFFDDQLKQVEDAYQYFTQNPPVTTRANLTGEKDCDCKEESTLIQNLKLQIQTLIDISGESGEIQVDQLNKILSKY